MLQPSGLQHFLYCLVSSNTVITSYMPSEARLDVDPLVTFFRKHGWEKRQWGENEHAEIR